MFSKTKKGIGVTAVVLFAMTAVFTSAANGQAVSWGTGATTFKATQDSASPSQRFSWTGGVSALTCNGVHANGSLVEEGAGTRTAKTVSTTSLSYTHAGLPNNKCTGPLETEPPITIASCGYTFHAEATITEDEVTASVDLTCSGTDEITSSGGALCTLHIPPQNGLKHVLFKTETPLTDPETVTGDATITGISYKHTGLCGNGSGTNGTYEGRVTASAEDQSGVPKHLTIT